LGGFQESRYRVRRSLEASAPLAIRDLSAWLMIQARSTPPKAAGGSKMAFWSSETLKERIPTDHLIIPYDPERVKHCACEMGVGGEAFVTSKSPDGPRLSGGAQVEIPPGQFALLITAEVVTIPSDAIGLISIRAGIKFLGLVNVSGFHVDP